MTRDARQLVEDSFVSVSYPFGSVIVREGDPADAFCVLVAGTARVVTHGERGEEVSLNKLGPGDGFGELALLEEGTRSATVRASSEVRALRLDRSVFAALVRNDPEIRAELELQVRHHYLRDLLRVHSIFARLSPSVLASLIGELRPREFQPDELVVREGDAARGMFIVKDGRLHTYQVRDGKPVDVAFLRIGDVFGEASLFSGVPRRATVRAVTTVALFELDADAFQRLLSEHEELTELVRERVSQYDFRERAREPLDFAQEQLPAAAARKESVGLDQVYQLYDQVDGAPEAQLEGEWEGRFVRPAKRIRRFPHVWQIDEADCGAACVAMVCRYFGRWVSLARVREAVQTGTDGTSLLGLARGCEQLGLASRTVKASKTRLDELPLPAVAHWEGIHWVVLYDTDSRHVRVADPARGLRRVDRQEFLDKWSGFAAAMGRTDQLEEQPEAESSIRWFGQFFRPHRGTLARALVLAVVAAGLQMLIPVFSEVIVDRVVAHRDSGLLPLVALAMLGAILLSFLATIVQRYLLSSTTVGSTARRSIS
jgi:ATP-binding cassette subfamily B protein